MFSGYRSQFKRNVSEGQGAVSKSKIFEEVFYEIPICCSADKEEIALEDIPQIGANIG